MTLNVSNKKHLKLLKQLVERAGTQGNAARTIGVDVSTVKRYLKGDLTIPERKAHVMQVIMNLDDTAFKEAIKKAVK